MQERIKQEQRNKKLNSTQPKALPVRSAPSKVEEAKKRMAEEKKQAPAIIETAPAEENVPISPLEVDMPPVAEVEPAVEETVVETPRPKKGRKKKPVIIEETAEETTTMETEEIE